jgi:hypothetical protein
MGLCLTKKVRRTGSKVGGLCLTKKVWRFCLVKKVRRPKKYKGGRLETTDPSIIENITINLLSWQDTLRDRMLHVQHLFLKSSQQQEAQKFNRHPLQHFVCLFFIFISQHLV